MADIAQELNATTTPAEFRAFIEARLVKALADTLANDPQWQAEQAAWEDEIICGTGAAPQIVGVLRVSE